MWLVLEVRYSYLSFQVQNLPVNTIEGRQILPEEGVRFRCPHPVLVLYP